MTLPPHPSSSRPARRFLLGSRHIGTAVALLIAFGVGGAAVHLADGHRRTTVLALTPSPVSTLRTGAEAAVKGEVADVFGNRFVIADGTGRALIDTGPAGDGGSLVKPGETVTVQGRFDGGSLRAAVLSHADGHQDALDPGPGGSPPPPGPPWLRAAF